MAVFACSREVLLVAGCYWIVAVALTSFAVGLRSLRLVDKLAVPRLPGMSRTARVLIGISTAGVAVGATARTAVAQSGPDPAPVLIGAEGSSHANPGSDLGARVTLPTGLPAPGAPAPGLPAPGPEAPVLSQEAAASSPPSEPLSARRSTARPRPSVLKRPRKEAPRPATLAYTASPLRPTWVVGPGDSFWSIAESVLAGERRQQADDRDIATYWRQLVATNIDRIPDPRDPDLLFPGDVLVLPAPPTDKR